MTKTLETAVIGTVLGVIAAGLVFHYLGNQPIITNARQGITGQS